MHTNDLIINDCCTRQTVECIAELLPYLDIIATTAFIVETINAVDAGTFVVPSENKKIFGIFNLVSEKKANYLN